MLLVNNVKPLYDAYTTYLPLKQGALRKELCYRFFDFNWGQSYLATLVTPQNCRKMLRNLTIVIQFAYLASDHKMFLFFRATFEQLSSQKATFDWFLSNFLRNYGKRFGKCRATCGKPYQYLKYWLTTEKGTPGIISLI